jgi:hypothetical protein
MALVRNPPISAEWALLGALRTSRIYENTSIFKMMDVSRHKSVETLRGYVRDAELFRDPAGAGLL